MEIKFWLLVNIVDKVINLVSIIIDFFVNISNSLKKYWLGKGWIGLVYFGIFWFDWIYVIDCGCCKILIFYKYFVVKYWIIFIV